MLNPSLTYAKTGIYMPRLTMFKRGRTYQLATEFSACSIIRNMRGGTAWTYNPDFEISTTADYTLTNNGSAEKCFNGSTNGQVTLPATTSYRFSWVINLTNTGTTSHTWAILFGGTATLTSGMIQAQGYTATSNALTAANQIYSTTPTSALVVTAASTSATENVGIFAAGILRINAAGTLIPQIKPSAATTGTAKVLANSFFQMVQIGSNTAGFIGPWS